MCAIDDTKPGRLASALAITFFPVYFLGLFFAIRLVLHSRQNFAVVLGAVWSRAITFALGIFGMFAFVLLAAGGSSDRRRRAKFRMLATLIASHALLLPVPCSQAEELFDPEVRATMLKRNNGLIAHVETIYNDIFVSKDQSLLKMAFQWKGWYFPESEVNLADPDDLPMLYARAMTIALIYPQEVKRVLILGLGGGAITTYLGRFLPDATIDTIELDPGVIDVAKKYFGIRETSKSRLYESDGRVFLNRHSQLYDLIIVDAFTGSYIPFHLMTREFYRLVRDRLTPNGVAAFNILPGTKLYASNVRTLKLVFDRVDLYHSGDQEVIVIGLREPFADGETLMQRAVAAQWRYRLRFDVSTLAAARRVEVPTQLKGEVLTDDFAPVNVYDSYGRRYRRKK
jgi:spermidine synthase